MKKSRLALISGAGLAIIVAGGVLAQQHGMHQHGMHQHGGHQHGAEHAASEHQGHGQGAHMQGAHMQGAHMQGGHMQDGHAGHNMAEAPADATASTLAYIAANAAMHEAMEIEFSGDADIDFIRGMIPHHEGAVVMAQIVLEHGSDPEVAELAREIIAAQQDEISWMRDWLAARGQ